MSEDASTTLFERIRERCRQLRCYGPDDENSNWVEECYDPASDPGSRLCACLAARAPQQLGFEYSPATEDQLLATEGALGFPLPPLLRALYAQVANGGFGFGYGLRGAMGDFDGRGSGTIVEQYLSRSSSEEILPWADEKVHLIDYDDRRVQRQGGKDLSAPNPPLPPLAGALPAHLQLGCAIESCLDCIRGGVYRVGITKEEGHLISLQATSLQEMREHWLQLPSDSPELLRGYYPSHGTWTSDRGSHRMNGRKRHPETDPCGT
jgi:hypothetical protein